MPVTYRFDGPLFRLDCVGEYERSEFTETYRKALDDPDFPQDASFLLDVSRSLSLQGRTPEDIKRNATFMGPRADRFGHRCAIVANSDLYFGLMRMAAFFAPEFQVETQVFRTDRAAMEWLGVAAAEPADTCG